MKQYKHMLSNQQRRFLKKVLNDQGAMDFIKIQRDNETGRRNDVRYVLEACLRRGGYNSETRGRLNIYGNYYKTYIGR
jgi:hypothetical protein